MRYLFTLILGGFCLMPAYTDEGMWLLNEPPKERLKEKYGFDLTEPWLEHARLASVRFNNGGSGSFVSPTGLIITNHHIGSDALSKLSTPKRNLLKEGFYAPTMADELKCEDLELNVLQDITDVTERVNNSLKDTPPAGAAAARRSVMAAIEKESLEKTGLRSDVVTLYQGGAYHLYRYKKFTDVRLVFAPESGIAGFGGDVDNFEFPRFNLDICFFRAYENDKPTTPKHFLKFSPDGPKEGDLVFVTGHPGTTNRLETTAKLEHRRDQTLPYTLARLRAMEAALLQYSERGPEQRRQASTDLHRVANARKAFSGQYQGLLDSATLRTKNTAEYNLSVTAAKLPEGKEMNDKYLKAIATVREVQAVYKSIEKEHNLIETSTAFSSPLFSIARTIVRLVEEQPKSNGERLREYRDSNLESLKLELFSPAPIYADLERAKLTASLTFLAEQLSVNHPVVKVALEGASPAKAADELMKTKLFDVAERKKLLEGGKEALRKSDDPMILLALILDTHARAVRKKFEEQVEEPERQAYGELAKVRFAVLGRTVAPDATLTLRLAYGVVKGYEAEGKQIPYATTFGGLFEKADRQEHKEPFDLPKRWLDGQSKVDPAAPFNFASTADTIGGNSGSPVLNRAGEFIGINFDRNRHGLVRNFVYTDVQARHISVHSKGILEALKLYDCPALLKELGK
ncbi:S46 family peptidase [Zavarzinella formosa]|uniref:S46 family peptidase n=1 Tax=Zavarzinella formosa TaxID=360055 RepID=UPI0002D2A7A3|nr:S46 family peptidase [Zavarzinella formosa]